MRHRFSFRSFFIATLTDRVISRSPSYALSLHDDPAGGAPAGGAPGGDGSGITILPSGDVQGQPRSAVEQASQAARERLAATGSALPPEGAPAAPAAPAAKPGEPARASDGTFAPKLPEEIERENAEKARLAAEAAARGEAPPPEGEQVADEKIVEIPVADGEPLKIEFDDPAVAEQVREKFEIAAEAERIQTEAQRQLDDVLAVREAVNVDPVGFVLNEIGRQPAAVEHLVMSLLTSPEHKAILDKVAKIASDPNELRIVAAEQKSARGEYREQAQNAIVEQRAVSQNLQDVKTVLTALVPRTMTPEAQRVAYADMARDLQLYAERHDLLTIPPQDIPLVLRNRLAALGIEPMDAAQKATEAMSRRRTGKGAPRGNVARPAAKGAAAAPPAPSKNGSAFVASAESRKAAVIPAAGAGSPGGGSDLTPPRNPDGSPMSIEQTIAFHRGRLNKGVRALPVGTA